jgi:DNA polymerase
MTLYPEIERLAGLTVPSAEEKLQQIAEEIAQCKRCPLYRGRVHAVPGEGPADADIMLIGEGPGYHEDNQGRPFVGQSGKFLDDLLLMAGLKRHQVFIGNVIKCRAPQNRDPMPDEIDVCTKAHLFRQIEAINPKVIVTLGRFSMALYVKGGKISVIHGQPRTIDGRIVVPMMHPAAALHQPKNRPLIEEDFRRLPEILAATQQCQQTDNTASTTHTLPSAIDPSSEQMSMF